MFNENELNQYIDDRNTVFNDILKFKKQKIKNGDLISVIESVYIILGKDNKIIKIFNNKKDAKKYIQIMGKYDLIKKIDVYKYVE